MEINKYIHARVHYHPVVNLTVERKRGENDDEIMVPGAVRFFFEIIGEAVKTVSAPVECPSSILGQNGPI